MVPGIERSSADAHDLRAAARELGVGYCQFNVGVLALLVAFDVLPNLLGRVLPIDSGLLARVLDFDPFGEYALLFPGAVATDLVVGAIVNPLVQGVDPAIYAASVLALIAIGATAIVGALFRLVAALMLVLTAIFESERAERTERDSDENH